MDRSKATARSEYSLDRDNDTPELEDDPRDGEHCRCGAQFLNGAWWTRMNGLGHPHAVARTGGSLTS